MIERRALERYLSEVLKARVELLALRPLKGALGTEDDPKGFGYGMPFEIECLVDGEPRNPALGARPARRVRQGRETRSDRSRC